MKSRKLEKLYQEYFAEHVEHMVEATDADPVCTLYGEDEFHINTRNKTLYLQGAGVIELPAMIEQDKPEWVGVKPDGQGKFDIVMGYGSPYDDENKDNMPVKEDIILAMPHSLVRRHLKAQKVL